MAVELKKIANNTLKVLKFLGYSYLAMFTILLVYTLLHKIFPQYIQELSDIKSSYSSKYEKNNLYIKFLKTVIYAPLMEELIFRLGISKKLKHLQIVFLVASIYLIIPILYGKYTFTAFIILFPILQFLFYNLLKKNNKYFKVSIIFSAVYFGLIHIFNFDHDVMQNPLSYLIMILPLIIFGYNFGRIRVKLGIAYSILGHMILNLIGFMSSNLL